MYVLKRGMLSSSSIIEGVVDEPDPADLSHWGTWQHRTLGGMALCDGMNSRDFQVLRIN